MNPPDDELTTAYREATRRDPWPASDCPSAEALERLALGEATAEERVALADHLVGCAGCAALVQELRSLEGWAGRAARESRSHAPARPAPRPRWPLALAASLLLAVALGFLWLPSSRRPPESDPLRGTTQVVTPADDATLAQPPDHFAWPAQPGATGYRIDLFDPVGEPVFESDWLGESAYPLAHEVAQDWPAAAYTWIVTVRGDVPRSRLGPYAFRIAEQAGPG